MKDEAALKRILHKKLQKETANIWRYAPVQMGMGASGIPDIICCKPVVIEQGDVGRTFGMFIGIEAKMGSNKPTKLQQHQLEGIAAAGGMALVVTGEKGSSTYKIERITV